MNQKNRGVLLVWKPTGYQEVNTLSTIWRTFSNPAFWISIAILDVVAAIHFKLKAWWMWAIAPSAITLAVVAILLRRRVRGELLISKWQAKNCNGFRNSASWLPNRYLNRIDLKTERTQDDYEASILLYRNLVEALITLGLYEETGLTKIKVYTGDEFLQVQPVEFHTDFILTAGIGYILLIPYVSFIAKINSVDERIISRVLRESGIIGWSVNRVSFDDDLVLFILKDETVSQAYDFSGVDKNEYV
ncbi:hypothetical protein Desaci_4560 [Desulfosporosinus acidiphilus SJ4]|uniref:Uncharacterized protein n=1 Tax=Desulfosporosinus acidiphilus (strain DSM 22704 / JCM 16185 / SJ4) TaxID=646529 RepID=I4DC75_DESAJ|nr:hypothetical protein [Desulfosporosinus acidiphilus]AFM43399.1 hypothetical protein Desaci_4560 [Desulfosporosinus acidiphilus SJ4]